MMNHYAYRRQAGVHSVTPRGVSAVTEEACNPRNPGRSLKRQRGFFLKQETPVFQIQIGDRIGRYWDLAEKQHT